MWTIRLFNRSIRPRFIAVAAVLAIAGYVVTHVVPIPGGVKDVMEATGGRSLLDQRPSFSETETYRRLNTFGSHGRETYRSFILTTDIAFPLTWLPFLFLLGAWAASKPGRPVFLSYLLAAFPAVWFAADMLENVTVCLLLSSFPTHHRVLAIGIGYFTSAKWLALFAAVMVPATILIVDFGKGLHRRG
jgi:hypothetical protein